MAFWVKYLFQVEFLPRSLDPSMLGGLLGLMVAKRL